MHAHAWCRLANNIAHTGQIAFLQRFKRPSLDVLLKHMPEVEAMRFLHNVVDLSQLECKLKDTNFSGDGEKIVEEVRMYMCTCICAISGLNWTHAPNLSRIFIWIYVSSLQTLETVVAHVRISCGVSSAAFMSTSSEKV